MGLLFFLLFFLLWHIIFHYFSYYFQLWQGIGSRKWDGADSISWPKHWGMAQKCLWRMPAQLHRLEGTHAERKAAWGSLPVLLYALFFILYALFVLAEQDRGPCKYVLNTASQCTPSLGVTTSLCNILKAAKCCLECPYCSAYMLLFYIISLLFQLFF